MHLAGILLGYWRKIRRSIVREGIGPSALQYLSRWARRSARLGREFLSGRKQGEGGSNARCDFERQFGLDTREPAARNELLQLSTIESLNYKHGTRYETMHASWIREVIGSLNIRHEDYVFIDIGSGKGKVMLVASDYPFRRIVGVEYCKALHEAAEQNILMYKNTAQRCFQIQSIYADAATFPIPPEPLVLFLYNPFDAAILRCVLRNLCESLHEHVRKVFVIYFNPVHAHVFDNDSFVPSIVGDLGSRTEGCAGDILRKSTIDRARPNEGLVSNPAGYRASQKYVVFETL